MVVPCFQRFGRQVGGLRWCRAANVEVGPPNGRDAARPSLADAHGSGTRPYDFGKEDRSCGTGWMKKPIAAHGELRSWIKGAGLFCGGGLLVLD